MRCLTGDYRRKNFHLAVFLALLSSSCNSGSGDATGAGNSASIPKATVGPTISPNPSGGVPLCAVIDLQSNEPTQVLVQIDDGTHSFTINTQGFQSIHSIKLLGLYANKTHTIKITLTDQQGDSNELSPLIFLTPPLPDVFPTLTFKILQPANMEAGFTLFAARYILPNQSDSKSIPLLLDENGQVIWFYMNAEFVPSDLELTRAGNLLFIDEDRQRAVEIDWLGNLLGQWHSATLDNAAVAPQSIKINTDSFHHEFYELPANVGADFVTLSSEVRTFTNYPMDEVDTSMTTPSAQVVGDVLVEFNRDGKVVRELKLLDILDPYRVVYGSLAGFWTPFYGMQTFDWAHANAVTYILQDNTYLISLRHQDALVKIKRDTGEIVWILGAPDRWIAPWSNFLLTPSVGMFEWFYHTHAPELTPEGNIILFDNGVERAIPPAAPLPANQRYSRAAIYSVNSANSSVSQVWAYGGSAAIMYSGFLGDADVLPITKNVLITDGARIEPFGAATRRVARILEVTQTNPSNIVLELFVEDPQGLVSWFIYRSERIPKFFNDEDSRK